MSRKISFRGILPPGEQDRIKLSTLNGKTGYKITDFKIISKVVGTTTTESLGKIYNADQTGNVTNTVDFSESDLLAVNFTGMGATSATENSNIVIFDNKKINQDIFVYIVDTKGETDPVNYYIELETMSLTDIEATMLTLQSIRTITE